MKRLTILCVSLMLLCGAAQATNYTWTAGAGTWQYDNALLWTSTGGTFPHTSGDNLIIGTAGAYCTFPNGTITLGEIHVTDGRIQTQGTGPTFRLKADNGMSGDFLIYGSGIYALRIGGTNYTEVIDADGDVKFTDTISGWGLSALQIVMRGSGKVLSVGDYSSQSSGVNRITVETGASVSYSTEMGEAKAECEDLVVNGTITGGTWQISDELTIGPSGQFTGGTATADRSSSNNLRVFKFGGGTYYDLKPEIAAYHNGIGGLDMDRIYRAMGDITVSNDFDILAYSANPREAVTVFDTDNGNGQYANMTVNGNFSIGANTGTNDNELAQFRGVNANSSTIDINGDATFRSWSYVHGGTSTWKFAGNVSANKKAVPASGGVGIVQGIWFDNTDMTQTTVVIDGASTQNLAFCKEFKLGDVNILNTSAGSVVLDDNLLLVGDLSVAAGATIVINNDSFFIFAGGIDNEPDAQQIAADGADLKNVWLMAGSATYVKLMDDLVVSDNLDIDAECKLFLNSYTLTAEGQTLVSADFYSMSWDEGTIYGTGEIPEPGTLLLFGTGILGTLAYIRRRRMK